MAPSKYVFELTLSSASVASEEDAPGMGYLQARATGEMFTRVKRRKATLQSYTYLLGGQSHSVQGELLWGNPADSIALASEKLCEGLRC